MLEVSGSNTFQKIVDYILFKWKEFKVVLSQFYFFYQQNVVSFIEHVCL